MSKLEKILENAVVPSNQPILFYLNKGKATQAIKDLFIELVDLDDRDSSAEDLRAGTFRRGQDEYVRGRNKLRAELRNKIGEL